MKEISEIEQLKDVMKTLRSENGCPWDREQTHVSLKGACIEEAAEVVCGINILEKTGNPDNLKEELGDLLMLIVMQSQIASEEGYFTFEDVARVSKEKMLRRHPHVFGNETAENTGAIVKRWEEIKKEEKAGREWVNDYLPEAFAEAKELITGAEKRKGFVKQEI